MTGSMGTRRPGLGLLSDKPINLDADDRLGFAPYADALFNIIDDPKTDTPLTMAISGPWGTGKTSLAFMVQERLTGSPARPHIICWFNAWIHDDAPNLGSAFAAEVAKEANRYRGWHRFISPLPSAMLSPSERLQRRVLVGMLALPVAIVATFLLRGVVHRQHQSVAELRGAYGATIASIVLLISLLFTVWTRLFSFAEGVARFVDDPKSEAAKGSMHQVSEQLGSLVQQATRGERKLVIFVDDLERCKPPRAIEVCEVASQLLGHPNVITVLVGNMNVIAASAEIKYADMEHALLDISDGVPGRKGYGRLYLEKMVQIQFELPRAQTEAIGTIVATEIRAPGDSSRHSASGTPALTRRVRIPTSAQRTPGTTGSSRGFWTTLPGVIKAAPAMGAAVLGLVTALLSGSGTPATISSATGIMAWATAGVIAAAAVPLLIVQGRTWLRRRDIARASARIDAAIRHQAGGQVHDSKAIAERVLDSAAGKGSSPQLVSQRVQRFLLDDPSLWQEAQSQVISFIPPLPRSAKRMLNHLRLLMAVAIGRDMFSEAHDLKAGHLGRWVVLTQRWPELASTVTSDPEKMANFESLAKASGKSLRDAFADLAPDVTPTEELMRFLEGEPKLSDVVDRLVYFLPRSTIHAADLPA